MVRSSKKRQASAVGPRSSADDVALRRRLLVVLERHSRTQVAGRTGTSLANVSRYASGTRMPASFCAALVREFGVNPVWWLTGEGVPFIADVAVGTGNLTGDLLEVVQALRVVSQMRLGSLGGKHHLRMLRDLGEAMSRYEDLRERLNRHSVPILRAVLHDLRKAMEESKFDTARDLGRSAEQLIRFCDDPDIAFEQATLQARIELNNENMSAALELTRKAIMLTFYRGDLLGQREFEAVSVAVSALFEWARHYEARRVADAAFALASEETRRTPAARWLTALVADLQVHSGELRDGVQALNSVRGQVTGPHEHVVDAMWAMAMLYSGAMTFDEVVSLCRPTPEFAFRIIGFPLFEENADQLAKALAIWEEARMPAGVEWFSRHAALLLRALRGDTAGLVSQVRKFSESTSRGINPANWIPILSTQSYRVMGRHADARRLFAESEKMIAGLPPWFYLPVMWKARHHRNALELGNDAQRTGARAFFRQHSELGYRCFSRLAL